MSKFKMYRKTAVQLMRPYVINECMDGISLSDNDKMLTSLEGGMIARGPDPSDQWYVSLRFFTDNYDEVI